MSLFKNRTKIQERLAHQISNQPIRTQKVFRQTNIHFEKLAIEPDAITWIVSTLKMCARKHQRLEYRFKFEDLRKILSLNLKKLTITIIQPS